MSNVQTGVTVRLEDQGQDFTEFDIVFGKIVETRPFQGWAWNGRAVLNENLSAGDKLLLNSIHTTGKVVELRYPVVSVEALNVTSVPAIVFYPAGSLGEAVEA